MNLLIGQEYKITSDRLNVIVNKRVAKMDKPGKEGKPTGEYGWKEISFHPNIERALNFVLNQKINTSDALSLAEVVEVIQTHKKEVEALISAGNLSLGADE